MTGHRVFVAGLPSAGKTTFLAALWHLIKSQEVETILRYDSLTGINVSYLNRIRDKWVAMKPIGRTRLSDESVAQINLRAADDQLLRLTVPDFAGEAFLHAWEGRALPPHVATAAREADAQLLMVNVDQIMAPRTVDEYREQLEAAGLAAGEELPFNPRDCPTAPILADVIGMLEQPPVAARPRKIGIALTAWDAVDAEGLSPDEVLAAELPLIMQMIETRSAEQEIRVFGVSAQGGAYGKHDETMIAHDDSSQRILLVDGDYRGHDLTRMLAWLLN